MIRMGRFDVIDKWDLLCRSWTQEPATIDLGLNRHGRPVLPDWRHLAFRAADGYVKDYIRRKCEALATGGIDDGAAADHSELNRELALLLKEIGYDEFWTRSVRFIDKIRAVGPAAAADDLPERVTDRLKETYKLGALLALRWTEDIGEIPDIEVLRWNARDFPRHAVKGKRNVLSMFCAREYGVIDVIHLHDLCPHAVTLVDFDPICLDVLRRVYSPDWNYIEADYKDFIRQAAERDLVYDLIVADPWRAMAPEVGFDMFATIMARCSDTIIIHYVKEMFDELGVAPDDLDALSSAITQRTGVDIIVTERLQRGSENCWLVIRKRAAVAPAAA